MRSPIHVLVYSDTGGGKTTFAATFPTPILALCFDPIGKDTPFCNLGRVGDFKTNPAGTLYRLVKDEAGNTLVRIEYYHDNIYGEIVGAAHGREIRDLSSGAPSAYPRVLSRFAAFDPQRYATVVLDSLTFFEIAARKHAQYVLNPATKEPRQWFNASTDAVEEFVAIRLGGLQSNVVVTAHVDESKVDVHGATIRAPSAPGRMRKNLGAAFSECYHAFVARTPDGELFWALQTRSDENWSASSQIGAPNPCAPDYKELWGGK